MLQGEPKTTFHLAFDIILFPCLCMDGQCKAINFSVVYQLYITLILTTLVDSIPTSNKLSEGGHPISTTLKS